MLKYCRSDVLRSIFDNVVKLNNIKHLAIYIPKKKENSTFHTIYGILCVMLDLHVPKIIAYLIERIVLFLHLSSFMEIFSCLFDTFPVRPVYFLLIYLFWLSMIFIKGFM